MSESPLKSGRDPLSSLRIDRSEYSRSNRGSKSRWLMAFLMAMLLLAGTGWYSLQQGWLGVEASAASQWLDVPDIIKSRPEVRVVKVTVESGRSADATVVATGYLESRRQAKIGARAPGRIQQVHVEEGSRVTKDQELAVLEHADLDASLAASKANVAKAESLIKEQQIAVNQTLREYNRMKALLASRTVSETEHDQIKFQYESSAAKIVSMQADVQLAQARLREAEQLKENMFIRAPFDGTVISKDAEVGESILPGGMGDASGRGSVVTIADLDHLEVDCDVKEDYINRISSGQRAEVAVDAVPGHRFRGEVRKVIPMGDRARATIKVKVSIVDADDRLFPDMSSTVYFLPEEKEPSVITDSPRMFCPEDAVVESESSSQVWIVDKENHAQPVMVTTGKRKDGKVEILSGLKGNERLIANPPELYAGQPVKLAS